MADIRQLRPEQEAAEATVRSNRTSNCAPAAPASAEEDRRAAAKLVDSLSSSSFHHLNTELTLAAAAHQLVQPVEKADQRTAVAGKHLRPAQQGKAENASTDAKAEGGRSEGCCDEEENDDLDEFTAAGNGCGEALSPPSSCADSLLLGPSLAATAKPAEWSLQSFPASANAEGLASRKEVVPVSLHDAGHSKVEAPAAGEVAAKPASFTAQAMRAIAQAGTAHADADAGDAALGARKASTVPKENTNNSSAATASARLVAGDDPMGVRQLYSLPLSLVGSCVSMNSLPRRPSIAATTAAAAGPVEPAASAAASPTKSSTDVFSMERFATFYEVALEELMSECERRVANAPAAWRDGQRQFIRGDSNRDLATSTLSFDSPHSSSVSPVAGHAPQFGNTAAAAAASASVSAYPPCFFNVSQNTHGLHTQERSGGLYAATRAFPPQPRSFFFSAAGQARQAELEKEVATETVPALLAALGRHHGKMAPMVFIAALAYLARVTVQCTSEFLSITRANWYRLTTTAILVAAKMYDEHSSIRLNAHFARSAGIPLAEMTKLELDFLYLIDFDLLLRETEVEQWLSWMEALAVRRDVMTPLQSYFVQNAEHSSRTNNNSNNTNSAFAVGRPSLSSSASISLCSVALPEPAEKSQATTAEASRTAGLSSEGPVTESTTVTSPFSGSASRAFTHVRVGSNTVVTSKEAALAKPAASTTIPLCEFHSPTLRSPASSLVMPHSLLDATRSCLSGVSLPGSATTPVACLRAAGVPPSPIHGVLPVCPPPQQTRIFSVVHGKREPPSPRSVRQLSRLGASPPGPLQPPPMERNSPVGFFKQPQGSHGHAHHHQQSQPHSHNATSHRLGVPGVAVTAAPAAGHGLCDAEVLNTRSGKTPSASCTFAAGAASRPAGISLEAQHTSATSAVRASRQPPTASHLTTRGASTAEAETSRTAAANLPTATATATTNFTAATSVSGSTRWGPFGMVQQVRDVLGVTASLVRGQLDVLAPAKAPEELRRPPPHATHGDAASSHPSFTSATLRRVQQPLVVPPPPPSASAAAELHRSSSSSAAHRASHAAASGPATGTGRKSAPAEFTGVSSAPQQRQSPGGRYGRGYGGVAAASARLSGQHSSDNKTRSPMAVTRRAAAPEHDSGSCGGEAQAVYRGSVGSAGAVSLTGQSNAAHGEAEEGDDYGYYEEEEGEYYEEDEYGYYGEDGYYYAYDEEEGEYFYEEDEDEEGWYEEEEEEEEAEAEYFQRCRPPLTHSPPSL